MRKNSKGFLLIEVLVSVTLISVGLIYVARSFSTSARAVDTATHFLKSVSLIEDKMWYLEAGGISDRKRDEGAFEREGTYRWRYDSERLEETPLNAVTMAVEWDSPRGEKQSVSLETYIWDEEE
jgi:Tfp pilus assembly protein PilV